MGASHIDEYTDLHKSYVDDDHYNSGHGHAYKRYGVDADIGAVVIVRPDQCKAFLVLRENGADQIDISKVATLDDVDGIASFFAGCMIEQLPKPETIARL